MKLILNTIVAIFLLMNASSTDKTYIKKYHNNGILKTEGWVKENQKIEYWYTYTKTGDVKSEGHYTKDKKNGYWYYYNTENCESIEGTYKKGKKTGWWIFTKKDGSQLKVEYANNKKNGLILHFKKGRSIPYKADRFKNDKKIGTWTSISKFKRDNPDYKR